MLPRTFQHSGRLWVESCNKLVEESALGTDNVRRRQTSIPATSAIYGKRCARVEHGLDVAFPIQVEIGSVEHKRDIGDFCVRLGEVQRMNRPGRFVEIRPGSIDLGIFEILPRAGRSERKDFAGVLVPLDGPARLAANPNHKEACFDVNLDELKGDALLIWDERQIAFTPVKGRWRRADSG